MISFNEKIQSKVQEIQALYFADEFPWIVGYSGGKDSTASLQLVWKAVGLLPITKRTKVIHVITTDTLVENPIVAEWVKLSLGRMELAAKDQKLPFQPHRLTPAIGDSFWVNLIGKGYPAPRPKFRWCTSRLKINASNKFISDLLKEYGETTLLLGTRSTDESAARTANMKKQQEHTESQKSLITSDGNLNQSYDDRYSDMDENDVRRKRVINAGIPGSWVYTPIGDWTTDDVWIYINQEKNPWGHPNTDLLAMYQGATEGGECPLVVDSSTQSCGDSRFGCYVCTMVDQDKSMTAMINNDEEKEWMTPLMDFRNRMLDTQNDRQHRDFHRMNGSLMVHNDRLVKGPYRQEYREALMRELLAAQKTIAEIAPEGVAELILIKPEELEEIRRIWVQEKCEIEDNLPGIYKEVFGTAYKGVEVEAPALTPEQLNLLREICTESGDQEGYRFETLRKMLVIEHQYSRQLKRVGIYDELWKTLKRGAFENEVSAYKYAATLKENIDSVAEEQENFYNAGEVT